MKRLFSRALFSFSGEWRNISSSFLTGRNIHLLKLVFPVILLLVSGSLLAQTTRISLKANQKTLKEVLKTIEQKSEYTFFYKDADCDVNKKISINVENESSGLGDVYKRQKFCRVASGW